MRDEHCHIVYGVDDGARSFEESCAMVDAAQAAGITDIVATPHMRWDDFDINLVRLHFAEVQAYATTKNISMTLGFEIYYDKLQAMGFARACDFATQGTSDILLEFSSGRHLPFGWQRGIYDIQCAMSGCVTIAHPERYVDVIEDFSILEEMRHLGCRIQVSAGDLFRGRFNRVSRCAKRILKENFCDALVSDAHRVEHYQAFARAQAFLERL